jgi:GSH-dependent disulfide-bond oxidoreductase
MGADYSIADISLLGAQSDRLLRSARARRLRPLNVQAWLNRGFARPAVQRGLEVTAV